MGRTNPEARPRPLRGFSIRRDVVMSAFMKAVEAFVADIKGEKVWVEELNEHSRNVAQHMEAASLDEANEALRCFAALFPDIALVALGVVALSCGSLVERGGDPAIAGPALLERLPRVNETAADFYKRCRDLAIADTALMDELRQKMGAGADKSEKA